MRVGFAQFTIQLSKERERKSTQRGESGRRTRPPYPADGERCERSWR
jgi:hypothetical protein